MSSGQWSPIAGTCLAAVGSLLVYATSDKPSNITQGAPDTYSDHSQCHSSIRGQHSPSQIHRGRSPDRRSNEDFVRSQTSHDLQLTITVDEPPRNPIQGPQMPHHNPEAMSSAGAGRSTVRRLLEKVSDRISDVAHDRLDTSNFPGTYARQYPATPGEDLRNPELYRTSTQYETIRERSRAASFAPSIASASGIEDDPDSPTQTSSRPEASPTGAPPVRRDTLTVPSPTHQSPRVGHHEWS